MKKRIFQIAKMFFVAIMVFTLSTTVYADNVDDLQKEKEEAEQNKDRAKQILEKLEHEKHDLAVYIADLNAQLDGLQAEIDALNSEKAELETNIEIKQAELEQAKKDEASQYQAMCARIQYMYVNSDADYMDAIMSADSMSDVLNQPEYVSAMADYDYNLLTELVDAKEQIIVAEAELQSDLETVKEVEKQVEAEEEVVSELMAVKEQEMQAYQAQIEEQERLIAQYDAEIQAAAEQIAAIEEEAEKDDDFVPYSGGGLAWPVPSSHKINSGFGRRTPGGVVTANHYGIDIGCPDGTPCVAAASGVVVLAQYSNTAGNWIIISHGGGLYTIYMHASTLYVSAGQYVNAGDTIMLSGATGATQGRHLHYEVRVGGYLSSKYSVDPMNYY